MARMSLQHLQIVSTQIIQPSSPTPPNLNIHTLSLFDQLAPHTFVPLLFFFSHHGPSSGTYDHTTVELLRQSLSTTLSRYYPFAGRIKDKVSIDCNDEGVTFVEARLEGMTVWKILENPRSEIVEKLFVDGLQWKDSKMGSLLKVQITLFECGGLSIGVLLSHKLGDLATLVKFIQDWGVITRNSGFCDEDEIVNPLFFSADLFPHGDLPAMSGAVIEEGNFTCKRFVFEGSKIESLKNRISEKVQNPSRVEVVSALIYKAIISASRTNNNSQNHPPTLLLQTLNLRKRVAPPLPETLVGSLVSFFPVGVDGERVVELHELVGTMRKEMGEFCEKYAKKYRTKEWLELIKKRLNESREILSKNGNNQLVYRCSSGCNFPIYEVDFGWGAADWITMSAFKMKNTVMMLDAKNGRGIEALVSLQDGEMAAFQDNEELLAFASLNPSVH